VSFDLTDPQQLAARAPAYALAFAESGRALDAQERLMNDLVSRAGLLMAAAAVTTSVFGGQTLAHGHTGPAVWVATIAFIGAGLMVIDVLWPRQRWEFEMKPTDVLSEYIEPADIPVAMIHRDLAIHRTASFHRNTRRLRRASGSLRVGMGLLVVEVVAWVATVPGLA
jgi:hypothetical protein